MSHTHLHRSDSFIWYNTVKSFTAESWRLTAVSEYTVCKLSVHIAVLLTACIYIDKLLLQLSRSASVCCIGDVSNILWWYCSLLILSGDTELNPGPSNFCLCTLNIRSILHPLHCLISSSPIIQICSVLLKLGSWREYVWRSGLMRSVVSVIGNCTVLKYHCEEAYMWGWWC